jgi:uncharacterized membrane protein SpoIIM required for sporulation
VAYCFDRGLGPRALGFIGAHGPVELSAIVIAGAAGLIIGQALIDPDELPRAEALRRRSLDGVRLLVGCAPFIVLIGLVEGFVSPGDLFPGTVKVALGLLLGAAFWAYALRRTT